MRRLILCFCFAVLAFAIVFHPRRPPTTAVTASGSGSPFPAVWALSGDPGVVSAASTVAAAERADLDRAWYAAVAWREATSRPAPAPRHTSVRSVTSSAPVASSGSSGECGGDLPSCSIMRCESGGDPTAQNRHSSASGLWQIIDSTWGGYGGYARAKDAPVEVQNAKARELWAGGAGRGQWSCR